MRFYYDPGRDIYDGRPWTEVDVADLEAAAESGSTLEQAAMFLCRAGSVDDVARKAKELGLAFASRDTSLPDRKPS